MLAVAFAPDGRTLAAASGDRPSSCGISRDRDRPGSSATADRPHRTWSPVAFAPDGRTLATTARRHDGTVILWDLGDPDRPRQLGQPLTGHTDAVYAVAFAPDGRTLATASADQTVRLWDLSDRDRPRQLGPPLTGHTGEVSAVAFAPDGRTLATGGPDGTVILWELADRTGRSGQPLTGHTGEVSGGRSPRTGVPWPPPARTAPSSCGICGTGPAPAAGPATDR